MIRVDPIVTAVFLLTAFTLAGIAQTAWFASPMSRAFAIPLDGGRHLRGRRVFGANKTVRGFVVMVPATAAAFVLLAAASGGAAQLWLWPIPLGTYAVLGAWAGFGFMAGELPNSFLKRQLDVEPGAAPAGWPGLVHFVLDRVDSGVGMLAALSMVVDVPWITWACVLLIGPFIHWSFSFVMFRLGLKGRAA